MAYEGRFDHSDRVPLATDFHFSAVGGGHRHARQCNRLAKRRRETTTGDLPFANIGDADHLMSAQNPTLLKDQTDQFVLYAAGLLGFQRRAADELASGRFPGNAPGHVGGQRRNILMDVLTVQVHAGFDPQGIPRAEADGGNARAHQIVEEARRLIGRQNDFQAVFTGIPGARDEPVTVGLAFERFELLDQVPRDWLTSSAILCRA